MTTATLTYTTDPDRILARASKLAEAMQASNSEIARSSSSRSLRIDSSTTTRRPSTASDRAPKSPKPSLLTFKDAPAVPKISQRSNTSGDSYGLPLSSSALERSATAPGTDSEKAAVRPALLRTLSPDTWPLRKSSDESRQVDQVVSNKVPDRLPRLRPQDILIPSSAREHAIAETSPLPSTPRLRESTFIPDHTKLKYAHPESGKIKHSRLPPTPPPKNPPVFESTPAVPSVPPIHAPAPVIPAARDDANLSLRESVKSSTTYMSSVNDISTTERSSTVTSRTSASDLFTPHMVTGGRIIDDEFTVEDCIALYEQGFEDDPSPPPSGTFPPPLPNKPAVSSPLGPKREEKPPPVPKITIPPSPKKAIPEVPKEEERQNSVQNEQAPVIPRPSQVKRPSPFSAIENTSGLSLPPNPFAPSNGRVTSAQIFAGDVSSDLPVHDNPEPPLDPNADRYGFKKDNQYITLDRYEAWDAQYRQHLDRRRQKWNDLMRQNSLNASHPTEFPARSDKVKRFVRKGIPPEWRGAAWFWYAGGPARLAQNPGLYQNLLKRCKQYSQLAQTDRDSIERDLWRTFPDNHRFKRLPDDPNATRPGSFVSTSPTNSPPSTLNFDRPMIASLRRVLQAFAVHQPRIGYCQSLNFLAGLLLLFLDGDEEKSFHLLCILTNDHLPGTHGVTLEGANVDIGVLMSTLKDREPALWAKLDDRAEGVSSPVSPSKSNKLPTISIATASWFMSCFVGNLPIESCCRVWDVLFYEGSKTLFRVALGIFRLGGNEIRAIKDSAEVFPVVQMLPRKLLDANALMEASFGRDLEGRGLLSQDTVKRRREERRSIYQKENKEREAVLRSRTGSTSTTATEGTVDTVSFVEVEEGKPRKSSVSRGTSLKKLTRLKSKKNKAPPVPVPPSRF